MPFRPTIIVFFRAEGPRRFVIIWDAEVRASGPMFWRADFRGSVPMGGMFSCCDIEKVGGEGDLPATVCSTRLPRR